MRLADNQINPLIEAVRMGCLYVYKEVNMGNVIMKADMIEYQDINVKIALDACTPAGVDALDDRITAIETWIEEVSPTTNGGE